MTRNADRRIENLQERIECAEEMSEDDQDVLQAFDNRLALLGSQYGKERREKLLRHVCESPRQLAGWLTPLTTSELPRTSSAGFTIPSATRSRGP